MAFYLILSYGTCFFLCIFLCYLVVAPSECTRYSIIANYTAFLFQVDTILDKENYTLEELLDEDEIIQECKALNNRLINL